MHADHQCPFFYWHVLTRCLQLVCAYSCRRSQSSRQQQQQQLTPPPLTSSGSNAAFFPKPRHEELYEEPRQPSRRLELVLFIALGKLTKRTHNVMRQSLKYCPRYRLHWCMRSRNCCNMLAESLFVHSMADQGTYSCYPCMHRLHFINLNSQQQLVFGHGSQ
jgi:hypothetical protein